jgi:hypothetical protein
MPRRTLTPAPRAARRPHGTPVVTFSLVLLLVAAAFGAGCGAWNESPDGLGLSDDGFAPRDARTTRELREALEMLRARARSGEGAARRDRSAPSERPSLPVEVLRPPTHASLDDEGRLRRSAVLRVINAGAHDFIRHLRLEPSYRNGSLVGYRLATVGEDVAWIREGGLRAGDVVRRVNGRSFQTPDAFMSIWDSLRDRSQLSVDVLRDQEELLFEWDIVDDTSAASRP